MPSGYNEHLGESAYVFHSYEGYKVDLTGRVWSEYYKKTLEPFMHNGQMCVAFPGELLNRFDQDLVPVSILNVVAMAYKTPWFNLCEIGTRVNAIPIDGNPSNVHPSNLLWRYPDEGLEHPDIKGFYYIPGFSRYLINKEGVVLNAVTLKEKQSHVAQGGYRQISITGEAGNSSRSIYIHRLLAFAFVPYPTNVKELTVNHKDLNRLNNSIDNLEWATNSENINHRARARKLYLEGKNQIDPIDEEYLKFSLKYSSGISIEAKDLVTKNVTRYVSINKASEALGINAESIRLSLFPGAKRVLKGQYIFRKVNDPWPELSLEDVRLGYDGQPRPVLAKHLLTGEIKEFPSAAQAIRKLGLSKKRVTKDLKNKKQRETGGYIFQYKDSLKEWER